jgi:hypothetical protein
MSESEFKKRIEQHLLNLIASWRINSDPQKIARYYIDAYNCILHNIKEHDVIGINKARKEFLELAPEIADKVKMKIYEDLVARGEATGYVKLLVALKKWFVAV